MLYGVQTTPRRSCGVCAACVVCQRHQREIRGPTGGVLKKEEEDQWSKEKGDGRCFRGEVRLMEWSDPQLDVSIGWTCVVVQSVVVWCETRIRLECSSSRQFLWSK